LRRNISLFLLLIPVIFLFALEPPFHKGVNLTDWIWSKQGAENIPFYKFDKRDIDGIKSLGCDVIRLPLSLLFFADTTSAHILDPLFFYFLDQAVDWSEESNMHLILDNHTQKSGSSYIPAMDELIPLWTQIAEHYKERSGLLIYELMNEPHNITDETWFSIQDSLIKTIRTIDSTRTIIATPIWNSTLNFTRFVPHPDTNIIYSFHFYEPFIFTHQGASWTNPSCVSLGGIPFPGTNGGIPDCPEDLVGTWVENRLNNYHIDGTDSAMYTYIDRTIAFSDSFNVPIFCGEFGVYNPLAPVSDRAHWYDVTTSYFEEHHISWTIWGYQGGYGIFKKGTPGIFHRDIDPEMIEALRLIMPAQDTIEVYPDTTGFTIYGDQPGWHIAPSIWTDKAHYDLYYREEPAQGKHCILLKDPLEYNNIGFSFTSFRDISDLVKQDANLNFKIKGNRVGTEIRIRFTDTDTDDPEDHPWKKEYILQENNVTWDDQWHDISIPLNSFWESGATEDGVKYEQEGKFDWSAVKRFDLSVGSQKLVGAHILFDNIHIMIPGEETATSLIEVATSFILNGIYPNPFNATNTIKFTLINSEIIKISVHDIQGKYISTITYTRYFPGEHQVRWNAASLSSGIYILRMQAGKNVIYRKSLLIK